MFKIKSTKYFKKWLCKIQDKNTRQRIFARLDAVDNSSFGDHKQVFADLFELRFFFGPGYRIYYTIQNNEVVFLVAGGDKSSQDKDIKRAIKLLSTLEE